MVYNLRRVLEMIRLVDEHYMCHMLYNRSLFHNPGANQIGTSLHEIEHEAQLSDEYCQPNDVGGSKPVEEPNQPFLWYITKLRP